MKSNCPRLISLEGGHGTGKSFVIDDAIEWLRVQGIDAVFVSDESLPFGRHMRSLYLEQLTELSPIAETLLVASIRAETTRRVVRPALELGKVVIRERFGDAILAFGVARELPMDLLKTISECVTDGLVPNITILLDIAPEAALGRVPLAETHRVEHEPLEFHIKLREAYLALANEQPQRICVLDASRPAQFVAQNVRSILATGFGVPKT